MCEHNDDDVRIREVALTLAVEATKAFTTSRENTIKWAQCFEHYLNTGKFDVSYTR